MNKKLNPYVSYSEAVNLDLHNVFTSAARRYKDRFDKKLNPSDSDAANKQAIIKFRQDVERINNFTFAPNELDINNMKSFIYHMLVKGTKDISETYDIESYPQCVFLPETLSHPDFIRFGHGANATSSLSHILDKLQTTGNLSMTESCKHFLPFLNAYHPPLFNKVCDEIRNGSMSFVEGARITTVPKNKDISRVIACEPTINLWFQLAVGRYLTSCLASIGLNIENQANKNNALACLGSRINGINYCTLDLSSASDSITPALVKAIFPKDFYNLFMGLRGDKVIMPDSSDLLEIPMVSTMGNGFTFPLLTCVCLAAVYAANCRNSSGYSNHVDFNHSAVFGDDIIVQEFLYDDVSDILSSCGFIINHNKSYREGSFRESCGGDYEGGVFITPPYVTSLETSRDATIAFNLVLDWSSRHHYMENTLLFLYSLINKKDRNLIPEFFNADQGIQYPTEEKRFSVRFIEYKCKGLSLRKHFDLIIFAYVGAFVLDGQYITRKCKSTAVYRKIYFPFAWCKFYGIGNEFDLSFEDPHQFRVRRHYKCHLVDDIVAKATSLQL